MGNYLRDLRQATGQTLREIAAVAGMDQAVLSKIENGNRLPTQTQTSALARTFHIPDSDMQARRIAVDFQTRYGGGEPAKKAIAIIRTTMDNQGAKDAG